MKKFLLSLAALAAMAPVYAGTGTEADPYTVADLLAMPVKVDGKTQTNIASAYVKGYIVGFCKSGSGKIENLASFGTADAVFSNVILADDKSCNDGKLCVAVQLPSKSDIRSNVNLSDNPGNLGKSLLVAGNVTDYFDKVGVKTPTAYTLNGAGGGEEPTPPTPTDRVNVANVAAFLGVAAGTEVTFTSPVNVVYQNGLNLYVEDATGGMFIYGTTNQTYVKGDVIPAGFEGKYTDFKGCIEFEIPKGVDGKFAAASGTAEVNPVEWTLEDISTDIQNQYVIVKGVAVEEAADGSGLVMTQNGAELTIYDKFGINIAAGENLNVTGLVSVFDNTLQLYPLVVTDAGGSVVEAVAAPVFSVKAGAVEEGTTVEITCATEGATIHYTVDGTEPTEASAAYTGAIVVDKDMTIKAIAVKEGLTNSVVVSAEYTIKKALNLDGQIDFTNPSALDPSYDMSKGEDDGTTGNKMYAVTGVWFTNGDLRVKGSISTTNTDARLYYQPAKNATQFRIYKGATLTVESTNKPIANVVITFNNGNNSAKQFTPALTATDDANVYTYAVSPSANVVEFTVGGSVQINNIGVVYDVDSGVEGVVAEEAAAEVEWFNLQGVRVENPENGLYIRRQGNKVEKVVIR